MASRVMPGDYDSWDGYHLLGMRTPGAETPAVAPGAASTAHPGLFSSSAPLYSPANPLFWFGLVLIVTGAAAASTELRVGPFKAGVSAGGK
jgi:hypothetical protein